jgi:diguanylate cyclase (GGDEF)-like protein
MIKNTISVFGSIGLQVEHRNNTMDVGIGGRGYDVAMAFSRIQEPCAFCTSVHPGSFSDFILMDAEENNIHLWADRDADVSFSGTVRIHDKDSGNQVFHAYPSIEKGVSQDLARKVVLTSKAIVVEGAFSKEFISSVVSSSMEREIPVFVIVRSQSEIAKLKALAPKSVYLIAGPFVETVFLPVWGKIPSLIEGVVISSQGKISYVSELVTIDPVLTRKPPVLDCNMVSIAAIMINQMVSWKRSMRDAMQDCMASLSNENASEQWDISLSIDRKFTKYFRQTDNLERDFLTGTQTRSFLERYIAGLVHAETPFSIMVASVDNMNFINQTYGHIQGDSCLASAAHEMKSWMNDHDVLGRWNGSEFVAIMPDSELDMAWNLAERVRRGMSSRMQSSCPVVVSFGVSQKNAQEDWHETLERAWQNLQEAKKQGGNRVGFTVGLPAGIQRDK